ncbi:MAG: hypothetical protein ACYC6Y_19705, partial [Thermoguttaceae bacterium]
AGLSPGPGRAEIPDYFSRIIKEGNVTFKYYDPVHAPQTHRGYTTFQLDVSYRSTYQYRWTDRPAARQLFVEPTVGSITYKLVNEVRLPDSLDHDRRWTDPLVRHEFDHVAMTLDPRVRLLVEHLCRSTPPVARELPPGTQPASALMDRLVHEAVEPRYQSVLQVLIANENDLDRVTRHGSRDLPDRRGYFGALFTEPNLKQHGFPYLDEVMPLLREKAYRQAELPYRFDD